MKKNLIYTVLVILSIGLFSCSDSDDNSTPSGEDGIPISFNEIPATSRSFLEKHFETTTESSDQKIKSIEKKKNGEYEIEYTNGIEIKFNAQGEWIDIDMNDRAEMPVSVQRLIPEKALLYISETYPNEKIDDIEKNSSKYPPYNTIIIELKNDTKIEFYENGELYKDPNQPNNGTETPNPSNVVPDVVKKFTTDYLSNQTLSKVLNIKGFIKLEYNEGNKNQEFEVKFKEDGSFLSIEAEEEDTNTLKPLFINIINGVASSKITEVLNLKYPNCIIEEFSRSSKLTLENGYVVEINQGDLDGKLYFDQAGTLVFEDID